MVKNNSHSILEFKNIRKQYGDCIANEAVSFCVKQGSIHAIVGENGAGKSTAMKILYGQIIPDSGEILLNGNKISWSSSAQALASGIGMVHQHFMLAGPHSALENILLGTNRFPLAPLNKKSARKKLAPIMKEYGLEVDLDLPVEELSVGIQQRVEILKLLYRDSEIFILDEPTAVLTPFEVENFFRVLRLMAGQGKTILLITHKLKEVMVLADRVTVFRAGKVVAEREVKDTNLKELADLMVGHSLVVEEDKNRNSAGGKKILSIENILPLKKKSTLQEVSLSVHEGEVLGIAGVEGNGQSDLIRSILFPQESIRSGKVILYGKDISNAKAGDIRALGIGVLPEDRQKEAIIMDWDLEENSWLGRQRNKNFLWGFFQNRKKFHAQAMSEIEEFDVRPRDLHILASGLSGGNQQKFVVARELYNSPRFILAAQPTRGVDVGAIQFIHKKILSKKAEGAGILLISSELDELMRLADRILVLFRGNIVAEFSRTQFDEKKIGYHMLAGKGEIS